MKNIIFYAFLLIANYAYSQSCEEIMQIVKSENSGRTYNSYASSAISKITFYKTSIDYKTYYFAIVCFKPNEYSYSCNEYIYQVGYDTELNYSMNYLDSAGEAFWNFIQPYSNVLGCSPTFN